MTATKIFALSLAFACSLFGEAPKVTVVHTNAIQCAFTNALFPGSCRQSVIVFIDSKLAKDTFMVGIRYLAPDGTETLQVRYPVKSAADGGTTTVTFYIDDIEMLSATGSSLTTNEVGVWAYDPSR
jgi:hypothetical protein